MQNTPSAPRVSVFIPAFNAERYIAQAIESVLSQTWSDFELLIIDDGSTDNTSAVLDRYAGDARVRIEYNDSNRGTPWTRNRGLEMARGEYIALLDADDVCMPDRLEEQVAFLDRRPDISVLGTRVAKSDEEGRALPIDRRRRQWFEPDDIAVEMLFSCPILQPTMMARSAVLKAYGYDLDFPVAQDYEQFVRMACEQRFAVLPQALTLYRQHATQATSAKVEQMRAARHRLQARQLAELGVDFDASDVARHDLLFKFKGRRLFQELNGGELDIEFVRWARDWIERLLAANARRGRYPEPAFSRIVVARWAFVCHKTASGPAGWAAWREFFAARHLAGIYLQTSPGRAQSAWARRGR
ncbi:glycosyltransferase family 2 protein [Salinisphaera sp.]|uniref:glycosyltransferase family 2 protein n=1 Tax=Salinisphaera sp. TaxID=1914330 RepID=UPI002D7827F1|nr:glycosyltransferase family 2 protein [Salinisphaera sp.]HET7315120.1 glycosyltransferase family 2 protein [Salinisphaera sp.]